jgi:hypothetical protein
MAGPQYRREATEVFDAVCEHQMKTSLMCLKTSATDRNSARRERDVLPNGESAAVLIPFCYLESRKLPWRARRIIHTGPALMLADFA